MQSLDRKLLRDMAHWKGQITAIVLIVACGIASFVTMLSAYDSLKLSQSSYYNEYGFAEVFSGLKSAPLPVAQQVIAIPGVRLVETRIVQDVVLDVPGVAEPASGRLISIPEDGQPQLNRLHIASGRYIEPGRGEALISSAFAGANNLKPGDTIGAILNGRWERLRVVGVALSPEYVYEIKGAGDPFPDNKHFGVIWMGREALATAFDMDTSFNDVAVSLDPGTTPEQVMPLLDRVLEPYGGLSSYARRDQVSNRFLSEEIQQLQVTATLIPVVFLGVAAFLLHLLLSRLVGLQRAQIAVLKAFGFSNAAVAIHYFKLVSLIVLCGTLVGLVAGLYLGRRLTQLYTDYYQMPLLAYHAGIELVLLAIGISLLASLLGAVLALHRAVSLAPAEAMRPEQPAAFSLSIAERIGLRELLSTTWRIIVRNLNRKPVQTLLSVLGISLAVALLVVGRYMIDAVQAIVDVQYRHVQRDDVTVVFTNPRPASTRFDVNRWPGVMNSEPFRSVPVRLRHEHRDRTVVLMGLPQDGTLRRLVDKNLREVSLPPEGIVLTAKLAELLGASPGQTVTVEVLEGSRPIRPMQIARVVDELIGTSAYTDIHALHRLTGEQASISGVYLKVDRSQLAALYSLLKRTPSIMGVSLRESAIERFNETVGQTMGTFIGVLVFFASVVSFGVIYNSARIALSERAAELATLRIIGFTKREVSIILLGEQAVLIFLALPLGALCGFGLTALMVSAHNSELFRLPLVITPLSYFFAAVVTIAVSLVSSIIVNRQLSGLDIISVLKAYE